MKKKVFVRIISMVLVVVMAVVTMAVAGVSVSAATTYTYKLTINTADVSNAGTDKDVYLYAYDAKGNQIGDRIELDTNGNSFEKGDTDVVTITLPKAMKSIKVATFGHADNFFDSFEDDWKLENIVSELMDGNKVLSTVNYKFDKWIECGWYSYISGNKYLVDEVERLYAPESIIREKGFEYAVLGDGTAEITGFTGADKEIVIPEYIDGYKVTRIGDSAFNNSTTLTKVTIPNSVTSIGSYAFSNCIWLTSVNIPDSVTSIESYAFGECISLKSITLPESVKSIGEGAFCRCTALTGIEIPNSVVEIGEKAFYGCGALTSATAPESITSIGKDAFLGCSFDLRISGYSKAVREYAEENGIEFCAPVEDFRYTVLGDGTVEIASFNGKGKDVVIPKTIESREVTSIGEQAFMCCSASSVTIPDSVTEINELSFAVCQSLVSVEMPDGLTYIGEEAFASCGQLQSIEIPAKVEYIMDGAFYFCESLTDVTVYDNVKYIGAYAFEDRSDLLVINGYADSLAQKYAEENDIKFNPLNA